MGRYDKFKHAHITWRNFVFIEGNDKFAIIVNIKGLIFSNAFLSIVSYLNVVKDEATVFTTYLPMAGI
ncbi:hypothetical protein PAJ34TS1_34100 [Paenibacillus azoreducens]